MRRAKRITALAVAAAMVLSNVAYAAPDTNTTTTQQGAESLNSQSDASGGVKDQASDTKGNTSTLASQSKEQVKQNESSQSTDPGDQKQTDSKADVVSQNQDQKKDEDSKETQKPSTEADSQKSETQNVDADKSEDTQEPSKEQEKVLYDITFDTPEKHGRVTDLDGKEVADGKTLKTDENGKAKFKVKPDAGYQVQAVYQMPDKQTPLKLVKDSYYEMQVEKNTTVKVVYQKIPAKNDSEDAGEANKRQENEKQQVQGDSQDQETQKSDDKQEKPAQTVTVVATDGARITVKASEGALPEGVTVTANPVDSSLVKTAVENAVHKEDKQLLNYKAYDITIRDADGKEIQPDKNITVSISNAGVAGDEKSVYHIADGARTAEKIADVSKGNVSTFDAKHFSIYVVAGSKEVDPDEELLTVTISFTYEGGVIAGDPYVLTVEKEDDQYVVNYPIPEKEGYSAVIAGSDSEKFSIEDGNLKAVFSDKGSHQVEIQYIANATTYTVQHLYQNLNGEYVEDKAKQQTLEGKVGELTEAEELTTEGFTALTIQQKTIEDKGKTIVEVRYERNTYTLTYMTTGGSYVPSVSAKYGATIELVSGKNAPTRKGFSFEGWFTDKNLQSEATDPFVLQKDTKLYAKWEGQEVQYKVVYMTENADDDGYSYAGTVSLKAKAGTKVQANADTQKPKAFDIQHFTFLN